MTIKELETLSEMERANVRFYEREGLITPKRMDNEYRDYSEDDLQDLLRIKLLRSLHISLDEIKALKAGNSDLSVALAKQIKKLEQEKQDVSDAQGVCRAIREEKANFATLNAAKYLEVINRVSEKSGSQYFDVKLERLPQVYEPWRRFFARTFDLFIYRILWVDFLAFAFHVNLLTRSNLEYSLDIFIAIGIMLILEPLWLHLFGTTPGKAIFGLQIKDAYGKRLSYSKGLKRTQSVIGAGLGYNLPVYNIVRLWKSYKSCSENETLPWDVRISYSIKNTKRYRTVLCVGAYVGAFVVLLMIHSRQMLPPNRGDITASQFVENFDYYADYLGFDFGDEYLSENGEWIEKEINGTGYSETSYSFLNENGERVKKRIDYNGMLDYSFIIENGYVKDVSFKHEIENNQDSIISSHETQMLLSSLAFIGAQKEIGLFSKMPDRIARIKEQIENNNYQDFCFTEANIVVNCDIEYSGYINSQFRIVYPEENVTENYYILTFAMSK